MMEFRLSASMISCLICLRQINIDFHNTNFRLMGDYEKFVEAFDAFIKSKDTNRNETLFQSIEHLNVDDFFLYNIKASMLNKRGDLKEAKENIEKSISLIDKTIGNMPISNRYSLFQKEGNFQYEVYGNNIKVLIKDTYITGAEIYAKLDDYEASFEIHVS